MSERLSAKYRPRAFADVVGQKLNAVVLQRMAEAKKVPQGLLFSGPSGTGKTSMARILAATLMPAQADDIAAGVSVDVVEVDSASHGGVAEVRSLLETLRYQSGGEYRIIIFDEAHSITRQGFDALLKPTEEQSGVIFIFVTTEPEKIPETIISRLQEYEFRDVSASDIFDRLTLIAHREGIAVSSELLAHLAQRSGGNVRSAIMSLDQVSSAQVTTVDEYTELVGEHDTSPKLLSAVLTGNPAVFFAELDSQLQAVGNPAHIAAQLVATIRDLLILRAGGTLPYSGPSLESRKELAQKIEQERLLAGAKILWDLKTRVRVSDDARGNLELAIMLLGEVFSRGRVAPSAPVAPQVAAAPIPATVITPPTPPRKLTLADLQRTV